MDDSRWGPGTLRRAEPGWPGPIAGYPRTGYCRAVSPPGVPMLPRLLPLSVALCGSLSLRAQEPGLRLDRLTPDQLEPFVQGILDSASRSLDRLLAVQGRRTVENTLRPYDNYRLHIAQARVAR